MSRADLSRNTRVKLGLDAYHGAAAELALWLFNIAESDSQVYADSPTLSRGFLIIKVSGQ